VRNLELKTRAESLAPLRARLGRLRGAARQPVVEQKDWYAAVPKGRLKLRVFGAGPEGQLILYVRPDRASARTSEFQVLPVSDAAGTLMLIEAMFGVRVCVRKRREVWLYRNARIHLDSVAGLGRFVEIEVVVWKGAAQARALMDRLKAVLGIEAATPIAGSYSDLLRRRKGQGSRGKRELRGSPLAPRP